MSATPNLLPQKTSEVEDRPILRRAGNTTTLLRKSVFLHKGIVSSPKDASPKLVKPSPNMTKKELRRSVRNGLCDWQCKDEVKRSEGEFLEACGNFGSKGTSIGEKSGITQSNRTTNVPSVEFFRSSSIAVAKSPWRSVGSSSSKEVLISEVNRELGRMDVRGKAASRGRKQGSPKVGRVVPDGLLPTMTQPVEVKQRCGWITPQSDPAYVSYHDMEWGVPVHDDRKLFELLVLVEAQVELSWPVILSKREIFRAAFAGFDPTVVANFDDRKIDSLKRDKVIFQNESKIRGIINNASRVMEIKEEFGSFDKYLWGFVNYKPMVSKYRHWKQVPVKTPKSELISKDLLRRGFRYVGPTVVYSFMQAMGMSNDHLWTCFRYAGCSDEQLGAKQSDRCTTSLQITEKCQVINVATLDVDY